LANANRFMMGGRLSDKNKRPHNVERIFVEIYLYARVC